MCLKVFSNIAWYKFQRLSFGLVTIVIAGCSSGTQRFSSNVYNSTVPMQSNMNTTISYNTRLLSQGDVIQSSELPPAESNDIAEANYNTSYLSSNGRVMGTPPRNLGTLSRSQANNPIASRRNSYIVQSGDTLLSIAQQVGISVDALKLENGINNDFVYIGQVLIIPKKDTMMSSTRNKKFPSASYKAPTTTIPFKNNAQSKSEQHFSQQVTKSKSVINGPSMKEKIHSNDFISPQTTGISKMRWPVRGRLLSQFGQKKDSIINRGIDIAVPEGSSVKAAENGIVIYASDGIKELGEVVIIRHENNIVTIYGHNSKFLVHKGQRVRRGDEIAKSGVSGNAKTPRVYFEVRKNAVPVDPTDYLER
ncbi:peptidoglycan DD-metalloendopeptidase family protein [Bartonella sp. F02]|uniref:peptidoglycan DD-metalloendopeptidase family protein n=1 Tax=Bartonella sp. F02 TaxID=2967262 RepID=UPI0022A97968|nr:peptidoglycan DD-metalloendopeptidase family protein [Bartonella sp. F02]MCZ2328578.1 peptidoglycan DD-metalloendopeptidase family protein [Bartonella sp. F02]